MILLTYIHGIPWGPVIATQLEGTHTAGCRGIGFLDCHMFFFWVGVLKWSIRPVHVHSSIDIGASPGSTLTRRKTNKQVYRGPSGTSKTPTGETTASLMTADQTPINRFIVVIPLVYHSKKNKKKQTADRKNELTNQRAHQNPGFA